jgi:Cu/Ag efflux protein CusF
VKVEGEVLKVDAGLDKITVRGKDGMVHEFQVSKDTLRDLKTGDKIEASLRAAPKCP